MDKKKRPELVDLIENASGIILGKSILSTPTTPMLLSPNLYNILNGDINLYKKEKQKAYKRLCKDLDDIMEL